MKVLIIGSEGFIGRHAIKHFSKSFETWGADVLAKEDTNNYYLIDNNSCHFDSIFQHQKFDICINASGNGSVPISLNRPIYDFELNVLNTIRILDAIRLHCSHCKFINLSSAAVYGNPSIFPIKESAELKPLSPYGWHKLYAEQICKQYYYLYNIKTINLRLFSVYGENLRKQLFWDIYQKCLTANEIELFGSGKETRDFIYIDDLLHALNCVISEGLFNGEAINVASGIETEIMKAATIFIKEIDPKIRLKFNMLVKPGDPLNWRADIELIKSLGFTNQTTIEKGLKNVVEWLKEKK